MDALTVDSQKMKTSQSTHDTKQELSPKNPCKDIIEYNFTKNLEGDIIKSIFNDPKNAEKLIKEELENGSNNLDQSKKLTLECYQAFAQYAISSDKTKSQDALKQTYFNANDSKGELLDLACFSMGLNIIINIQ